MSRNITTVIDEMMRFMEHLGSKQSSPEQARSALSHGVIERVEEEPAAKAGPTPAG